LGRWLAGVWKGQRVPWGIMNLPDLSSTTRTEFGRHRERGWDAELADGPPDDVKR
jgi:hypothetical protein